MHSLTVAVPVVATSRLISELVANAITYGRADEEWRVRVEWFRDGTSLRVEVHNPGCPANVGPRAASDT